MSRELKIIKELEKKECITANELALSLDVSAKTIRNDLKILQKVGIENGFQISSKPRYGFTLKIENKSRYHSFIEDLSLEEDIVYYQDRVAFIAMEIIISEKIETLTQLMNRIHVSQSTMYLVLKDVEELYKEYNIKLVNDMHKGYHIIGDEINVRKCMYDLMIRYNLKKYYSVQNESEVFETAKRSIRSLTKKYNISLTEMTFYHFLIYLFVDIKRIEQGNSIKEFNEQIAIDESAVEFQFVDELVSELNTKHTLTFSSNEQIFLVYKLMGIRSSMDFNNENYDIYVTEDIYYLSEEIIEAIDKEFGMGLKYDFDLKMNLLKHLIPMTIRIQFSIPTVNLMLDEIKERYKFGYFIAEYACQIIEEKYKTKISEDEIGFLAVIFSLSIERKKNSSKNDILLVCGSSSGSSHLLLYKFKQEFSDSIRSAKVVSISELRYFDFDMVDYVFTTVPIIINIPVPIVQVGYFLDDEDAQKIRNVFNQERIEILKDYYKPDQFVTNLQVKNKNEAIKGIFKIADEKYNLGNEFYDSMISRELLAKTTFGNKVAIPHTVEKISSESFAYVAVLDEPIDWDGQPVQLILLFNLGDKRGDELVKFYDLTMKFIMSHTLVDQLLETPTFNFFLSILQSIQNESIK